MNHELQAKLSRAQGNFLKQSIHRANTSPPRMDPAGLSQDIALTPNPHLTQTLTLSLTITLTLIGLSQDIALTIEATTLHPCILNPHVSLT